MDSVERDSCDDVDDGAKKLEMVDDVDDGDDDEYDPRPEVAATFSEEKILIATSKICLLLAACSN